MRTYINSDCQFPPLCPFSRLKTDPVFNVPVLIPIVVNIKYTVLFFRFSIFQPSYKQNPRTCFLDLFQNPPLIRNYFLTNCLSSQSQFIFVLIPINEISRSCQHTNSIPDSFKSLSHILVPIPFYRHRNYEPRREKTGLRDFRPRLTQTDLYFHRNRLEA